MKKRALFCALALVCTLLAACGGTETPSSSKASSPTAQNGKSVMTKEIDNAIKNNPDIKPGAEVSGYLDEEGNERFSYTNPDGSGGGGVILD